ncbi:hypothetical protein ACWIUD_07000 [Helicobacter sp. 23-1044]
MKNIKILNRFDLGSAPQSIGKIQNGVSVVTQDGRASLIENGALKTQITLSDSALHKFAKGNSANANFICACAENSAIIAKIAESRIKKYAKITSHTKAISASSFSEDSAFFASGGEDGRIYIYTTSDFKKILSLPYRPDYIASLNFSRDSRFIFASCFDKSNVIFDLKRAKMVAIFYTNEVIEWGEFFESNTKVMLISRDFKSIIYDISAREITSSANIFSAWANVFCIDEVAKIAIVGARDGGIYLVNTAENRVIFYLSAESLLGISAVCLHLGCIFLGGINGEVVIISYKDDGAFENACRAKDYALASEMLEKNIFLSLLPCAKVFDDDWEGILKKAISLLGENKIDLAIALTNPFTAQDLAKKSAFAVYLDKKDSVKKFKDLVEKNAFEEAYNMTLNAKFLLKTSYYESLEDAWQRAFNSARKILEDSPNDAILAKRYLEAFLKTPKKDAAMQLLNNLHIFAEADSFIKEQDFKAYFALVGNFAYLKECALYKKVLALGENFYDKLLEAKKADNYAEFERIYAFLLNFSAYKDTIISLNIAVAKKREFLELIAKNRRVEVYKLANEFEELQNLVEFKDFSADFEAVAKNALDSAHKGEAEKLGAIFGEYVKVPFWAERICAIYKIAYLAEFDKHLGTQSAINWEQSVKNYIKIFGADDEIDEFCQRCGVKIDGDLVRMPFALQKSLISRVASK